LCSSDATAPDNCDGSGRDQCQGFRLLEDITVFHFVKGLNNGRLVVDGLYHTGEGYDEGTDGTLRMECRKCLSEFPLPAGVDNEWE